MSLHLTHKTVTFVNLENFACDAYRENIAKRFTILFTYFSNKNLNKRRSNNFFDFYR